MLCTYFSLRTLGPFCLIIHKDARIQGLSEVSLSQVALEGEGACTMEHSTGPSEPATPRTSALIGLVNHSLSRDQTE